MMTTYNAYFETSHSCQKRLGPRREPSGDNRHISGALLCTEPSFKHLAWVSSLNPRDHLTRQKLPSPSEERGKLRSERPQGIWWKVAQLRVSKGSTKTKTNGSQSKEKGDPLPQEAAARGTGDRNFCRSGKIRLLLNAEEKKLKFHCQITA